MRETTSKPITNTQILDVLAEMSAWLLAGRCTGGPWARNARGRKVLIDNPSAASVCLIGALWLAAGGSGSLNLAVDGLLTTTLYDWKATCFIGHWNDFQATDAEVQELLSRAAHSLSSK